MFWKIPKPHRSALEWLITLSFATLQFLEVQLDEFSKNYGVFLRNAAKKSVWKRKASFFVNMLFLLRKQECASPATLLLELFEELNQDFFKKKQMVSSDKPSFMLWVLWDAIR